mmetsp:Transcript_65585/g.213562  ORF Transcript_65585/g.213562 Transcript_65585/m.213562 type:complete len:110 (-) Transcript_65585:275-604(-)
MGTIMHSYVFNRGSFVGNGFVVAQKLQSGGFNPSGSMMVESWAADRLFEFVAATALFRFHVRAYLSLPRRLMVESWVANRLFEFGVTIAFFRFHVQAHLSLPCRRCGSE